MKLELISKQPEHRKHETPLLLIHGAWHGAWCWNDGFMDYLVDQGWEVNAMSLRGHGLSEGRAKLRFTSMADYVADVEQVVNSMKVPPILVGHSMGGGVVQKYLETQEAPGAVLLASLPPSGTWPFNLRVIRRHPMAYLRLNLTMSAWPLVETPELVREWFYSASVSEEQILRHHERLQDESFRAALDMLILNLPKPIKVNAPILVLGGEKDVIFTVPEVQKTAKAYGTEAIIFPGMAHNLMSEPGWEKVADRIMQWAESVTDNSSN